MSKKWGSVSKNTLFWLISEGCNQPNVFTPALMLWIVDRNISLYALQWHIHLSQLNKSYCVGKEFRGTIFCLSLSFSLSFQAQVMSGRYREGLHRRFKAKDIKTETHHSVGPQNLHYFICLCRSFPNLANFLPIHQFKKSYVFPMGRLFQKLYTNSLSLVQFKAAYIFLLRKKSQNGPSWAP